MFPTKKIYISNSFIILLKLNLIYIKIIYIIMDYLVF